MPEKASLRIAAVADIHVKKTSAGALQPLFSKATESADVLLLCGDLTDYGTVEEAKILAKEITSSLRIPAIGVLGNHDFESGKQDEVVKIMTDAGVTMLDGTRMRSMASASPASKVSAEASADAPSARGARRSSRSSFTRPSKKR